MGSDTGGSIRGPAALCGIVGLKPTYGLVSRAGVYANSFTFDHAGPMTWTVEDCATMLQALAGRDPKDPEAQPPTGLPLRPTCRGAGPFQVLKTQDSQATPGRPAQFGQSTMPTSQ